MADNSYEVDIKFNNKNYKIFISINRLDDEDEKAYHYNLELLTKEQISGNEFQKLKKYIEDEGYIDAAIDALKAKL